MTVEAATDGGWNGTGISLEFRGERAERFVRGLAMYFGEHFVLEVSVFDTWDSVGHRGRSRKIY